MCYSSLGKLRGGLAINRRKLRAERDNEETEMGTGGERELEQEGEKGEAKACAELRGWEKVRRYNCREGQANRDGNKTGGNTGRGEKGAEGARDGGPGPGIGTGE